MAADTPPTPTPRRPEPSPTPTPGSGRLLLFACGIGLVALGQFYLLRFPDRMGTGARFLGLGLVAFAVALVLASPAATGALARARAWVAALVRQHPWRLSLVLLSGFLTWGVIDGLRSSGQENGWSLFPLWVAACASYLLAFMPWGRPDERLLPWRWSGDRLRSWPWSGEQGGAWLRRHRWEVVALGSIALLATVLRFVGLGSIPSFVGGDEGTIGIQSLNALRGEISSPFATAIGGNHGTLYLYLIGQGMNLFGSNAFGLRVTSAIAGSLTVICTYLLARNVGGRRVAVLAGALLSVSHMHIHFSHIAETGSIQDAFFAVAVIYFLDLGLRRRGVGTLAFSGFLLGFFFCIYMGSRLMVLVIPAALMLYYLLHREKLHAHLPGLAAMAGALLITTAPMGLWALTHTNEFLARVYAVGIIQNGWLAAEVERQQLPAWHILLEQHRLAVLSIIYYPVQILYNARLAMLDYFTAVAFLLGAVYTVARAVRDRTLTLLVVWIVLGIILGSALLLEPEKAAYRILIILPALAVVAALGLVKVWDVAVSAGAPPVVLGVGCGLWLTGTAFINLNYYFREFPAAECTYTDVRGRLSDRIGRYVGAQPVGTQTYLFGEPHVTYGTHASLEFFAQGRSVANANEVPLSRAAAAPAGAPLLLIFAEEREAEYREALARFPGGRTEELRDCAGGTIVLRAFQVP